jgi:hypothetical protein
MLDRATRWAGMRSRVSKSSLECHQPAEYRALNQGKWRVALNAKDY